MKSKVPSKSATGLCAVKKLVLTTDNFKGGILYVICVKFMCPFGVCQSCWNCGRKASETCSGCMLPDTVGSFCQHKDWENHHRVCGQALSSRQRGTSSSSSGQQQDGQTKPQTPTLETNVTATSTQPTETSPTVTTASTPASRPLSSSPDVTKTEDKH